MLLLSWLAAGCGSASQPGAEPVEIGPTDGETTTPAATPSPTSTGPTPTPGLVDEGARLFFQETFDGNGRTCGTCHPATASFTLTPAFIASLPADDPLFFAERVPELAQLEEPALMHGPRALILENVDGFDQPPVFRGVPHLFDVAVTAPFGWSGNVLTLEDFVTRAVVQHFPRTLARVPGVDFRLPTSHETDALAAFMRSLTLPPDVGAPPSSDAAARGRDLFFGRAKCSFCHGGPLFTDNGFFDTGVTQPPVNLAPASECDPPCAAIGPREAGGTRAFNTPSLLGLRDTAPYFHDNSASTIRDAVAHYTSPAFNASPGGAFVDGIALSDAEIDDVTAFLATLTTSGED
jgi:cytochrome c peroxidase